ncbi:nudix hydrolase 20, chloroplastic isoform X2 [Selaginella moellendorffii]|uniref:nudix hydrolase 20, chloroplastic isoform X2 n=1 Tax=Selaginella moellendorffii TaxID=88036 RepID=UPI000D1D07C3|nr:nudix hydrolase 20, chloroplastic isoform X2 [Selaginella moellendorffii]|eukprot:XP_024542946.1 nudix hydrolase 20, chloroplastic isoform X2 [Selaginella moellendorffii]
MDAVLMRSRHSLGAAAHRRLTAAAGVAPTFLSVVRSRNLCAAAAMAVKSSGESVAMEQYFRCVEECNRGRERRSEFLRFLVKGHTVGYIHPRFAALLEKFPQVFTVATTSTGYASVEIHERLETPEQRTTAVDDALRVLRRDGFIPGWRDEHYPVVLQFGSPAFFSLERAAVPFFGTKAYGVHMNGYVTNYDGSKQLWVAKRSKRKQTYPGYLDHLVAGGQPVGLSCSDNIVKECEEEAGIPKLLAEKAIPVGAVSYETIYAEQCKRDVLFCYDLELPLDFEPSNKDGEVECFRLDSIPNVVQSLGNYKPNCALVVVDFLFRHGYIRPEQQGYLNLVQKLKSGECL